MLDSTVKDCIFVIFHKSIMDRKLPTQLKTAELKMTFQDGLKTERGNYRLLSMLSIASKLLVGILCSAIDGYRVSIPNTRQWGYKKGLLKELLLVYLTKKWQMQMERENLLVSY